MMADRCPGRRPHRRRPGAESGSTENRPAPV